MKPKLSPLNAFAKKRKYYFWYTNPETLDAASIVEGVLNYADFDDVRELIHILGIKKVARIFREQTTNRTRLNYDRKIINFYSAFFNKYA